MHFRFSYLRLPLCRPMKRSDELFPLTNEWKRVCASARTALPPLIGRPLYHYYAFFSCWHFCFRYVYVCVCVCKLGSVHVRGGACNESLTENTESTSVPLFVPPIIWPEYISFDYCFVRQRLDFFQDIIATKRQI